MSTALIAWGLLNAAISFRLWWVYAHLSAEWQEVVEAARENEAFARDNLASAEDLLAAKKQWDAWVASMTGGAS